MIPIGQVIDGNAVVFAQQESAEQVPKLDKKAHLVTKVEKIDNEILRLRDYEDFFQRFAQLEKYLQSPDFESDYGKYQAAFQALTKAESRLNFVLANRSPFRDVLCFLGLMDTVQELEDQVERYGWIAEQLRKKLKLTRCISLEDEYEKLDVYLEKLIAKGMAPFTVSSQIQDLKFERGKVLQQLIETEARLCEGLAIGNETSSHYLISESTQSYEAVTLASERTLVQNTANHTLSFSPAAVEKRQTAFTQLDCWNALNEDLRFANETVVIVSPYLTMGRGWWFFKRFQKLLRNNISVTVITLPSEDHSDKMIEASKSVIKKLLDIGVEVVTVPKIHQKLLIIDSKISWEGSLNWLSHKDTVEHVRRIDDSAMVSEATESLNAYLFPGIQQAENLPPITKTNKISTAFGGSIVHTEFANIPRDQIESILFDCSECCEGGTFSTVFGPDC